MKRTRNPNCDPAFPDLRDEKRQEYQEMLRLVKIGGWYKDGEGRRADRWREPAPEHTLRLIPYRNGLPYVPTFCNR